MTASAGPALKRLHREFGDRVRFVTLYVREAHPGERYPQPKSFDEKLRHARDYRRIRHIPWTIAVDDVSGSLHRALDPKPNAAYLVDRDGRVRTRILWSNDFGAVRRELRAVAAEAPAEREEWTRKATPMLRGVGMMDETFSLAGQVARKDVLRQVPPMLLTAKIAGLFKPLPPLARGAAAMATQVLVAAGGIWAVRRLVRG